MTYRFRNGRPDDVETMFRLDRICFQAPFNFRRETFRYLFSQSDMVSVVAENEAGEIVGFIIVEPMPPDASCVSTIDIHPGERRKGLGKDLLRAAMKEALGRNLFKSYLQVYVENRGAIDFYKSLGYQVVKMLPSFYGYERNGLLMFMEYPKDGGLKE